MIVPMTRYTFVLHAEETPNFLENLRELGVVDITTVKSWRGDDKIEALNTNSCNYLKIAKAMRSFKSSSTNEKFATIEEAINEWEEASRKTSELEAKIAKAEEDLKSLEIWGDFDKEIIKTLKSEGVYLHFFVTSAKNYFSPWEQIYPIEVIERKDSKVYFIIAGESATEKFDVNATELRAPEMSYLEKQAQIEQYIKEQKELQDILAKAALSAGDIKQKALEDSDVYNFEHTLNSAEDAVEGYVKILEGWSEKNLTEKVTGFLDDNEVIYYYEDAKIENNPPIKLKNNFFARLFEPVGRLYMNPAYNELDLTPFFAPFFMIFFGMCLGDAGYGLMFIIAITALWKKIPKNYKDYAKLVLYLAAAGTFFGFISGNMFGIELIKIDALKGCQKYMLLTDPIKSFYFSIILGVIQVMFGQILRIVNRSKRGGSFIYGLSSLGWCILFLSSMGAYAADLMSWNAAYIGTGSIAYKITLIVAGVLILFFANPKANIFASFGKGLYSIYEMATGIIGDLISYVRLFAIGLAGAIIAQVFNELAIGLSGDIIILKQIIMLIILVIGHGLNIFVSSLGAFVHPVRLTFVEFYKNAEFEGGGRSFNPFRKSANCEENN